MYRFIAVIALFIGLAACSDSPTIPNALNYEINKLSDIPGYSWFNDEYNDYSPNPALIQSIRESYNASTHKFVFFTRPSCTCPGEHLSFPQVYKILQLAGIPDAAMEFYSMSSIRSKHIYDSGLTINSLPSFFVFKSGSPIYSLSDTLNKSVTLGLSYPIKYEEVLIEALNK